MKFLGSSIFVAVLAVLAAGCSPSANSEEAGAPTSTTAVDGSPTVSYPAADYQEQSIGRDGGILRVSTPTDNGSLDVHLLADTSTKWLGRLIFDNLVYLDHEGNITPWLAASWTVSPDGKTYVFKLREGVTFSDGAPFDAEAVRANLERIRDPATRARMTTAYIAPYVDGTVIDRTTFQANLSEPYSAFLHVLAQSWFGLVSPKALKNPKTLAERPVGTGPFVVQHYTRQKGIRFVKRADYGWPPPFMKRRAGPAYLDAIEVDFVPEALLRYTGLSSGQHDFITEAPPQNTAAMRADRRFAVSSRVNLGNPVRNPTFNVTKPPFDDVRVRQAVARAIDREALAQLAGFGEFRVKTDYLSATTPCYDPSFAGVLRHDPAAAQRLLDEAGWTARDSAGYRVKDGVRLSAELLVSEASTSPSTTMIAVQSDLKRIGFEIRIVQLPQGEILDRRAANHYQLLGGGYWHTNTPDGLFIVYHGAQVSPRYTGQNSSRLQDAVLDGLLSEARRTHDATRQRELYSKAQQRLVELVPAVPVYENHTLVAYRRHVRGLVHDTSHNTPFFACVWLAEEDRS